MWSGGDVCDRELATGRGVGVEARDGAADVWSGEGEVGGEGTWAKKRWGGWVVG